MDMERSRILVIGATGKLGRELVRASAAAGHPTVALVREAAFSDADKSQLLRSFAAAGVTLVKGSLNEHQSLLEAIKLVDVVISAVPAKQALEQNFLIQAIKEAGCIKRFVPSEFGADPDKVQVLNMDYGFYERKAETRRLIENEGLKNPPREKVEIFGDGNIKAVFIKECDVATFTISTIDDPRTLNKVLYLRPPGNTVSIIELVEMWEMKLAKKLERIYVPEEQILNNIREMQFPSNMELIFIYSAFIKGDHTRFSIDQSGLEVIYAHACVSEALFSQKICCPVLLSENM